MHDTMTTAKQAARRGKSSNLGSNVACMVDRSLFLFTAFLGKEQQRQHILTECKAGWRHCIAMAKAACIFGVSH